MEQKYILGFVALTIVTVLGISLVAANGFKPQGFEGFRFMNPHNVTDAEKTEMQQQEQAMHDAIKNNDYTAWSIFMQAQITQENFNKIVENYNKMTSNNFTGKINPESNFTGNETRPCPMKMNMNYFPRQNPNLHK